MEYSEISSFIWGTADLLRSSYKQHEYGDIILPFTVLRRLDVMLEPSKANVLDIAGRPSVQSSPVRDTYFTSVTKLAFYNTSRFTMTTLLDDPDNIHDNLVNYVLGFSENVREIFERFDFVNVIKSLDDHDLLYLVVQRFCDPRVDLSPASVSNADMGTIYEELIRKFSEASNETAGEHFSPRDGLRLASELLVAGRRDELMGEWPIVTVYDPCAGTGGALTEFADLVTSLNPTADVRIYAQEINDQSYAICKSDTLIKGKDTAVGNIYLGDTLANDRLPGEHFGFQISNPPYGVDWKRSKAAVLAEHDQKGFAGRFGAGIPRISDGQLLFLQHMISKMRPVGEGGGRIAVFMNGSPLFTGAAGSGESEIRRYVFEHDLLDAIIAMPNDFFFNTGIATYIWVLDNAKEPRRKGKVQLINANGIYTKMRRSLGSKRNELSPEQIEEIIGLYEAFDEADAKLSKVFENDEFGYLTVTVERPLRDANGKIVRDRKGKPKADSDLRDVETIPLTESIDDYLSNEIIPYAPDAWIEPRRNKVTKTKELGIVGFKIPFNRFFYEYVPPRQTEVILEELHKLEEDIETLMRLCFR